MRVGTKRFPYPVLELGNVPTVPALNGEDSQ